MNTADSNKVLIKLKDASDGVGSVEVLAGQTSANLEIQREMREYTSKTTVDGNGVPVRRYTPTRVTSTISLESLYDPSGTLTQDDLMEMCYDGILVEFVLGNDVSGSKVAKGEGYLSSASGSYSMDETASASFTIQVDGGITFETVA
ncbi:phage tail tube protein [Echinicola sp. 20G]|uniref:phage tail tube protein n=1 Tax=Echinicola sp. 20G TaxID=2781961 RepID=UPI0019111A68|nr:phage tail tube protein [Echinicola sp. 20G]